MTKEGDFSPLSFVRVLQCSITIIIINLQQTGLKRELILWAPYCWCTSGLSCCRSRDMGIYNTVCNGKRHNWFVNWKLKKSWPRQRTKGQDILESATHAKLEKIGLLPTHATGQGLETPNSSKFTGYNRLIFNLWRKLSSSAGCLGLVYLIGLELRIGVWCDCVSTT